MDQDIQLTKEEILSLQNILGALSRAITKAVERDELKNDTLNDAFEIYKSIVSANKKLSLQLTKLEFEEKE